MAGFRRSTWFAVGLILALQPAEGEASPEDTASDVT